MSALLQQPHLFVGARRLSELEATREIGRLAVSGIELETTLDRIASVVLSVAGIRRVLIEAVPELASYLRMPPVWGKHTGAEHLYAWATGEIKAGPWSWGQFRVYFDLRECKLESPLAFTRFVAQQIACFLNRLALLGERDMLLRRKARNEERLLRRKLVERAKGILAERHALSQQEALRMLVHLARDSRRSLGRVAQSIILART